MQKSSTFSKLSLAFILACGAGMIWIIAGMFLYQALGFGTQGVYERLLITKEGEPLIVTYDQWNPQKGEFRGLDGQSREINETGPWLTEGSVAGIQPAMEIDAGAIWSKRILPFTGGGKPPVFWYYLQDKTPDATGYFVGYDSVSNRIIGYYGKEGLCSNPPLDRRLRFAVPPGQQYHLMSTVVCSQINYYGANVIYEPWDSRSVGSRDFPERYVYLIDGNAVVRVDLLERESPPKTVFSTEGLLGLAIHAGLQYERPGAGGTDAKSRNIMEIQNSVLIISTAETLFLYDPADDSVKRIERPDELKGKGFSIGRPVNGNFILNWSYYDPTMASVAHIIFTLSPEGNVISRQEAVLQRGSIMTSTENSLLFAAVAPHPLGSILGTALFMPLQAMQYDASLSYGSALRKALGELWLYVVITFTLGIVFAGLTCLRQRRYGDPVVMPWVIFVFITGVPGYLGYLMHRRWPVRGPCPTCAASSPRDRDTCLDCGKSFPLAELKGIEVFA